MKMKDYVAKPCHVRLVDEPHLPERNPPIRERKSIPTQWLEIKMTEGKNRQIRHMTAAIGHPTLRLVRIGIGKLNLGGLKPGEFREILKSEAMDSLV
jgi:23S rRNA pseudouridine2457 synthase